MSVNNSTAMTGALFIHKGTMQRHINAVHLKIKPYECEQCQKFKRPFKKTYQCNPPRNKTL